MTYPDGFKMTYPDGFVKFVKESNRIEGILGKPSDREVEAIYNFVMLPEVTVADLETLAAVIEPGVVIRDKPGLNVCIGQRSLKGGPEVREQLESVLKVQDAYNQHIAYELLHPFMDCNGRTGRALWLHKTCMHSGVLQLGFLHTFYYQTLEHHAGTLKMFNRARDIRTRY